MASTSKDEFVETDRAGIWQYYLREKKEDRRPCVKNAALLLNVKADLLVGSIHINVLLLICLTAYIRPPIGTYHTNYGHCVFVC